MDTLTYISSAGVAIIAVILLGSLVTGAVLLARLWTLRAASVVPRALSVRVRDLVLREEVPEAMTACKTDDSPLARVLLAGLRRAGRPRAEIKEFLTEVGRHEAQLLQRGLGVLEVVAVVSPLLGLLGTVWGMIDVFRAIEVHGVGNAAALAGGIGTALYTTFAGLLVAIPVRVSHTWVLSRVDTHVLAMEEEALDLLELIEAPAAPPTEG